MKLAVIVPTKDRPKDLRRLLESIEKNSRRPDLVVIVDGSDDPIEHVTDDFGHLNLKYVRVRPPSLPKQRNAGIEAALPHEADWLGFLDDDLVLDENCFSELEMYIGGQADDIRGVGLLIKNQPMSRVGLYNRLFLIDAKKAGKITASGFAGAIPVVSENIEVEWLYGGATFWHHSVLKEFRYDEWFQGTGYLEDVDFSYRVSRKYQLRVCAFAKCLHLSHPIRRSKQKSMGEWQIVSWWYFAQKYKDFSTPCVLWGMVGVLAKNWLSCMVKFSPDAGLRGIGNLKGLMRVFNGTVASSSGFSK